MAPDESDPFTDTGLMGNHATATSGSFTGAKSIHMVLLDGESGATYTCTQTEAVLDYGASRALNLRAVLEDALAATMRDRGGRTHGE